MSTTLVLGVGNTLLSDEGAGIHVLHQIQSRNLSLPDVQFLDGGTLSFTLAGPLQAADNLIVLDAADLGAEPGAVRCMMNEQMDLFLGAGKRSAHEVGLSDLLDIARLMESLPARRALIGIQPQTIKWGSSLSTPVNQAIVQAADMAVDLIRRWMYRENTGDRTTGNMPLLLHEIRHCLQALLDEGKQTVIDLRSLPLGPCEEADLEQALGVGEVSARLDALGPSTVQETAFPGVWIITHFNSNEEIVGKFIEITLMPSLLNSQKKDVAAGLEQLKSRLEDRAAAG